MLTRQHPDYSRNKENVQDADTSSDDEIGTFSMEGYEGEQNEAEDNETSIEREENPAAEDIENIQQPNTVEAESVGEEGPRRNPPRARIIPSIYR